jgi:hypothetical protein
MKVVQAVAMPFDREIPVPVLSQAGTLASCIPTVSSALAADPGSKPTRRPREKQRL